MVNRTLSLLFAVLVFAGVYAAPTQAQDRAAEIRALLEQRDRQVKSVLGGKETVTAQQREQLKKVINDNIDFQAMGKAALGPHWDGLTAEQRTEFVNTFSEIVRHQSLSNLDIYRAKVTYGDVKVNGNTARALTTVAYKEVPAKVEYALNYHDGAWHVEDIILDNVSTVQGYARSFQTVIRKRGFDALMASLNKKLDQVKAES